MMPAAAAPVVGSNTDVAASQNATNTLRIELKKGTAADGSEAPGSVVGLTIKLERLVGIDPQNQGDIDKLKASDFEEIKNTWQKDLSFQGVTNANGSVTFSDLPNGVYLVTSIAPSDGGHYRVIAPFLVAVPFHAGSYAEDQLEGVVLVKSVNPEITTSPAPPPPTSPPTTKTPPTATTPVPVKPPAPPKDDGRLAMTGAQVIGLVIAAAVLIGGGFFMIVVGRRRSNKN